jgi:hypothetical protein
LTYYFTAFKWVLSIAAVLLPFFKIHSKLRPTKGGLMARTIAVRATSNPPSKDELKRQNAVVVHNLYEAAQVIANQRFWNLVEGLDVRIMFLNPAAYRAEVDIAYYELITKKPVFQKPGTGIPEHKAQQLSLKF